MNQLDFINRRKLFILLVTVSFISFYIFSGIQLVKATTYTYTLNGPYYDGGDVANADIGIAIQWINGSTYYLNLSANGITPDTDTIYSTSPALLMTWNASTTLNLTRIFEFTTAETQEYNITIPVPVLPIGTYAFSITDFYGMTNPYLQTSISPDGTNQWPVERRSLNASSTVTFVFTQYGTYTITIQCDQGSISYIFTAENVFSTDYPILAGAFPVANTTIPVFTAQRLNSSLIGVAFADATETTNWLFVNITHKQGSGIIYDYSTNNTGSSQAIYWNLADSRLAYIVTGIADINGEEKTWIIQVPKLPTENPWLGVFDFLGNENGTLPYYHTGFPDGMSSLQIAQLVAAGIILFFLSIGSFKSAGACCVLAWIVAGIMLAIGWFGGGTVYASIPLFSLAGVLSIIVVLYEGKETVGSIP